VRFNNWILKVILALNNIHILPFLILLLASLTSMSLNYAFAAGDENDIADSDGDGIADPSYTSIIDSDSDGIPNSIDDCPTEKETYNKFQDDDGCPDSSPADGKGIADTDGDGINDYRDHCPTQPETYNGILDLDGCPDAYIKKD